MRKLIMWNLMSLDGFFEGPNRDISWHSDVWGPELEQLSIEQGKEIGALLFGRITYELMAGYWPTAKKSAIADYMNALPKYVFSRTLKKTDWANTTLLTGDPASEVAKRKRGEGTLYYQRVKLATASRPRPVAPGSRGTPVEARPGRALASCGVNSRPS